jgi:hypothetical protein
MKMMITTKEMKETMRKKTLIFMVSNNREMRSRMKMIKCFKRKRRILEVRLSVV